MDTKDIKHADPSTWHPTTNPVDLAVIGKMGEELNECGIVSCRIVIQGVSGVNPSTGQPNLEWLKDEVADVQAMLDHTIRHFKLDEKELTERRAAKYHYKAGWYKDLELRQQSIRAQLARYILDPERSMPSELESFAVRFGIMNTVSREP